FKVGEGIFSSLEPVAIEGKSLSIHIIQYVKDIGPPLLFPIARTRGDEGFYVVEHPISMVLSNRHVDFSLLFKLRIGALVRPLLKENHCHNRSACEESLNPRRRTPSIWRE